MIWFLAEDDIHYKEDNINKLKKEYLLDEVILFPSNEDIIKSLKSANAIGFLAPFRPSSLNEAYKNTSLFNVIRLKNYYEPFTKEQIERNLDKNQILTEKLGIKVLNSSFTFKDYAGAEKLIEEAKKLELKMLSNLKPKGFLIVGLPGTGKSFFAKCFAGETKRTLVEFNISKIMEAEKPLEKLEMVLAYFKNTPGKYLIWIDEIEKMFANENSQQILGVFLTELNEFASGKSNALFIATANNIKDITDKNPELFRPGGRFDKIIALLPPPEENAIKIFNLYINIMKSHFEKNLFSLSLIIRLFDIKHSFNNTQIEKISKHIYDAAISKYNLFNTFETIKKQFYPFIDYKNDYDLKDNNYIMFKKVIETIQDNEDEIFRKIVDEFSTLLNEFFKKSIGLQKLKQEFINNYFCFNNEQIVHKIINEAYNQYRSSASDKKRFVYTPAEISTLVQEIYSNFYLNPKYKDSQINEVIVTTVSEIYPLQVQFKNAISKMKSESEYFYEI